MPCAHKSKALTPGDARYLVPALVRGLNILGLLSAANSNPTLTEVASSLGVTRSSAYRLLYTLCHLGFVEHDVRAKTYALSPQVLALGHGYLAARDVPAVALPHLERLRDRTGWSAHLGELHGREVVYLARMPTRRPVSSTVHVGTRLPAHATTMGRILLSGLADQEIRERYQADFAGPLDLTPFAGIPQLLEQIAIDRMNGLVAVQRSGYEPGVASVAAPIRDASNRIVAAINVSAVASLLSETELDGPLKEEVGAAAAMISRDLGRLNDTQSSKQARHTPDNAEATIDQTGSDHGRHQPPTAEEILGSSGGCELRLLDEQPRGARRRAPI